MPEPSFRPSRFILEIGFRVMLPGAVERVGDPKSPKISLTLALALAVALFPPGGGGRASGSGLGGAGHLPFLAAARSTSSAAA
jgi:hypothetical protein